MDAPHNTASMTKIGLLLMDEVQPFFLPCLVANSTGQQRHGLTRRREQTHSLALDSKSPAIDFTSFSQSM